MVSISEETLISILNYFTKLYEPIKNTFKIGIYGIGITLFLTIILSGQIDWFLNWLSD